MWNLKKQNKVKTDSQIQRTNEWLLEGVGEVKQMKGIKRYKSPVMKLKSKRNITSSIRSMVIL